MTSVDELVIRHFFVIFLTVVVYTVRLPFSPLLYNSLHFLIIIITTIIVFVSVVMLAIRNDV